MCGRYQLTHDPRPALGRLGVSSGNVSGHITGRYNIAPTQPVLVVREHDGLELEEMTWQWPASRPGSRPLINARAETALERRTWKDAMQHRRCLLPATGFYEWRKEDRQPFLVTRFPNELMLLGGLWQEFEDGSRVVILTSEPNPLVAQIHNRQPVVIRPGDLGAWFSPDYEKLLEPIHRGYLRAVPISKRINDARQDDRHVVQPEPTGGPELR